MACPALPTCGMALAESERQLPEFLDTLEKVLVENGLEDVPISIRSTGCPNGCARPYLAEIGIVGKAPGKYNLFLGADYLGRRLNTEVAVAQTPEQILERLTVLLKQYATERNDGERFGDYCHRAGAVGGEA
jgi:sulfite reductase (NADPH) hemoprotein beta-component